MRQDEYGFLPENFELVGDETAAYTIKVVDKDGNEIPYKVRNSKNEAPGLAGVTDENGNVTMLTNNVSSNSTTTDVVINQGERYVIEPSDLQDEFTVVIEKIDVEKKSVVTTNISSAQISEPFEYENGYRASVEKIEGISQVTLSSKEKDDYFKDGVIGETNSSKEDNNQDDISEQKPVGGEDELQPELPGGEQSENIPNDGTNNNEQEENNQVDGGFQKIPVVTTGNDPLNLEAKVTTENGQTVVTFYSNGEEISLEEIMAVRDSNGKAVYKQLNINEVYDGDYNNQVTMISLKLAEPDGTPLDVFEYEADIGAVIQGNDIVIPFEMDVTTEFVQGDEVYVPPVEDDKGFLEGVGDAVGDFVDGVGNAIGGIFGSDEKDNIEYTDDMKTKPSTTNTVQTEHGTLEVQKDVYEGNTIIYSFWRYDESGQRVEVTWEELGDYIEVFTVLENGADVGTIHLIDENGNKIGVPVAVEGPWGEIPEDAQPGSAASIIIKNYDQNSDEISASQHENSEDNRYDVEADYGPQEGFFKTYLANPVEETICDLMLAFGDFIIKILNDIVEEEVTVTALVYNEIDAVNPNFYDDAVSGTGLTAGVKQAISKWYNIIKLIAITVYIAALLAIGLQILLASTGNGFARAKALLLEWVKGILYLMLIPYFIKFCFLINEAIVETLRSESGYSEEKIGTTFGNPDEWSVEELEFRSPEYVSKYTGTLAFGSEEATKGYVNKIPDYEQNLDLMRLMRAYAGATLKIVYAIIWLILLGQLVVFIVMYYKRYFMIAFLIVMYPLVCIFYGVSVGRGKKGSEISKWMKELFTNIFAQSVHAIVYSIITGICVSAVQSDISSSATINWLIIIVAINFVSEGEKILKNIVGAVGNTTGGTGDTAKGIKGAFSSGKKHVGELMNGKS